MPLTAAPAGDPGLSNVRICPGLVSQRAIPLVMHVSNASCTGKQVSDCAYKELLAVLDV